MYKDIVLSLVGLTMAELLLLLLLIESRVWVILEVGEGEREIEEESELFDPVGEGMEKKVEAGILS
jgi:hypothetical protein